MSIIILLILTSILVASGFVVLFFWAVQSGQYEDVESPSIRILYNDDTPKESKGEKQNSDEKRIS